MADQKLAVEIVGKDSASSVFKVIGSNAKSMGTSIEGSTKSAAAGTKQLETGLKNTATASDRARSAGAALGVGVAALGASFAIYANSVVSQQQSIAALQRQYGDAANDFLAFADTVASHSVFNDDEVLQAINSMAVLRREYGLTDEQIQALITRAADLAALNPGMGLVDAAMRVQSAVRGEAESIESLGVAVSDSALGIDRMATTTSNAEKASIRYAAIMDQSSFATGAAGDQAETTSGKIQKLSNFVDDTAQSFIGMTGPVGEAVGSLTSFGLEAGIALGGIVKLAGGFRDLAAAQKGASAAGGSTILKGLAGVAGEGGLAAGLSSVAAGAVAVTAAFTPLVAVMAVAAYQADKYKEKVEANTDAIDLWAAQITDPALHEGWTMLAQDVRDFNSIEVQDTATGEVHNFTDALDELLNLNTGDLAKLAEILEANGIAIGNLDITNLEQMEVVYNAILQVEREHADWQRIQAEVTQSHAQAVTDLTEQYGDLGLEVTESTSNFTRLWMQVNLGKLATKDFGGAAEVATGSGGRLAETFSGLAETGRRATADIHLLFAELERGGKLPELDFGLGDTVERAYNALRPEIAAVTVEHEKFRDSLAGGTDEMVAYTQQAFDAAKAVELLSTNAQLFQAAGIHTPALDVAVNLQGGQGAFDAVFGAIKSAQGMASSLGGAKSWADELIGDRGTWSTLDDLINEGRISADKWEVTQQAQESITRDVTNAQRDLLAVQVNLAPTLAAATHEQAVYIDSLQNMNETQQLAALGYMDSAESAKAMSLAQLAASSTNATMQKSTTEMIQAAADADPVLKAMLVDMGLINEADGTVNFDTNAKDIGTAITELSESIDALIVAIGGVPTVHTDTNAKDTQGPVDDLTDSINGIPDTSTTDINVNDNASGTIGGVSDALDNLNGKTANTYLNNYVTTVVSTVSPGTGTSGGGAAIGGFNGNTILPEYATGGTVGDIPRYAGGGTYAMVGEYGPEMVWLNRGEQVTNAGATKSRMQANRQRGDGSINIYGPLTLQPAGNDAYDALQQAMRSGSRR